MFIGVAHSGLVQHLKKKKVHFGGAYAMRNGEQVSLDVRNTQTRFVIAVEMFGTARLR